MEEAAAALASGQIVAVKGIGGFHLMAVAEDDDAVRRLRERKHREHKPLAIMVPDVSWATRLCEVGELEERALRSPEAPIVLMTRRGEGISAAVAMPDLKCGKPDRVEPP